eukprot:4537-Heterococcus_DN1.PRE.2
MSTRTLRINRQKDYLVRNHPLNTQLTAAAAAAAAAATAVKSHASTAISNHGAAMYKGTCSFFNGKQPTAM